MSAFVKKSTVTDFKWIHTFKPDFTPLEFIHVF